MCVFVGVGDGVVEVVEEVALVGEAVEGADGFEDPQVFGPGAFEQHGDVAVLRARSTISPRAWAPVASSTCRSGRRRITTCDVGDGGELGEEPLGGAEEQGAVEAVGDDVLAEQRVSSVARRPRRRRLDRLGERAACGRRARSASTRGDGDADLDGDDEVERDGGDGGEHEHERRRDAGRAQHRADVVDARPCGRR